MTEEETLRALRSVGDRWTTQQELQEQGVSVETTLELARRGLVAVSATAAAVLTEAGSNYRLENEKRSEGRDGDRPS